MIFKQDSLTLQKLSSMLAVGLEPITNGRSLSSVLSLSQRLERLSPLFYRRSLRSVGGTAFRRWFIGRASQVSVGVDIGVGVGVVVGDGGLRAKFFVVKVFGGKESWWRSFERTHKKTYTRVSYCIRGLVTYVWDESTLRQCRGKEGRWLS